jgi:Trypsin-like peptidase domain
LKIVLKLALATAAVSFLLYGVFLVHANLPQHAPSMVLLHVGDHGLCSGVYIGNNELLTAAHCEGELTIETESGVTLNDKATRLYVSEGEDVALYTHPKLNGVVRPAKLSCSPTFLGQNLEIAGNPYPLRWMHTWGKVSAPYYEGYLVADALIGPGSSGGPAYDSMGRVRGIVDAMIPVGASPFSRVLPVRTFAFLVPSTTICRLLGRAD